MASTTDQRKEIRNRLKAYAHPRRWAIFTILTERAASPAEITVELGLDRGQIPNVDYHTKYLEDHGCAELVEVVRKEGRPPIKRYRATEAAMIVTDEWEDFRDENPALAQLFLGKFMQVQLDDYILALKAGTLGRDKHFEIRRTRRILDQQGLVESMKIKEREQRAMDEVERRAAVRLGEGVEEAIYVSDSFALFKLPAPNR